MNRSFTIPYRSRSAPLIPRPRPHTRTSDLPPCKVSSELATQLSDTSLSPDVSPARRVLLDQDVRTKIGAEVARLRGYHSGTADGLTNEHDKHDEGSGGVDIVRREIEAALERENLDRERDMAGDAGGDGEHGDVKNSTVLLGDLEEVRQKVDRYRTRTSLTEHPEVKAAREAIASCYRFVLASLSFLPRPLI
jgi:altered-inheritance-of-mitochondria protein 13